MSLGLLLAICLAAACLCLGWLAGAANRPAELRGPVSVARRSRTEAATPEPTGALGGALAPPPLANPDAWRLAVDSAAVSGAWELLCGSIVQEVRRGLGGGGGGKGKAGGLPDRRDEWPAREPLPAPAATQGARRRRAGLRA